jgi:probable phosphoglycerate mutase
VSLTKVLYVVRHGETDWNAQERWQGHTDIPLNALGLRERSFGCFEGLTREQCERLHPRAWREWVADRRPPPGAETHEILTARVVDAMGRAAEQLAVDDAPAVVVTHGGALRAIVQAATGRLPAPVKNAAVWRVEWRERLVDAQELTA